jgi:eukaryotic-like serine/threonine-protein kinase
MTGAGGSHIATPAAIDAEVEALLLVALEHPPPDRQNFLLQATDDPELRKLVEELLRLHARGDEHIGRMAQRLNVHDAPAPPMPKRVGPFRIERELGRGGMSVVYLGVRDDGQFSQQVAIKFLPTGPALESMLRRFEAERRILAGMEHPNLARLLDGGISAEGWPYFVMEYVDGLPITRYCDDHRLSLNQRLQLFRQVLDVVQYAHRNLVVHRDLKPSNILVTAEGRVKLLDFGIAKVLDDGVTSAEATLLTQVGGRPLTPGFASPEQIAGDPVTTASDVYSLGALLYHLLTGLSPYRAAADPSARLREAVRAEMPANPSARVREAGAKGGETDADVLAASRSTTPARLARQLEGDLDIICQVALRKEPERRYATVEQLAADLDRYRNRLPVLARAGNWRYLAGRFVRRHALGLVAGILIPAAIIGGLVVHAERLGVERDRAEASALRAANEAAKSRQVTEYLVSLFRAADPAQSAGREITATELVQRGTEQTEQLADEPALQAAMLRTLGQVNQALGRYKSASELLARSLAILDAIPGTKPAERAELLAELAVSHFQLGQFEQAERFNRTALDELPRDDLLHRAPVLTNLGIVYILTSRYDEAQALLEQAVQAHRAAHLQSAEHATAANALGTLLSRQARHAEAIAMLEEAVALRTSLFGAEHPATSIAVSNLGIALLEAGHPAASEVKLLEALAVDERLLGEDHPSLAVLLMQVASAKRELGATAEAIEYLNRALAIHRAHFEESHPGIATALSGLGTAYLLREDWAQAEEVLEQAIAIDQEAFGPASREVAIDLTQLGVVRLRQARLDEAESLLQRSYDIAFDLFGEQHSLVGRPLRFLAEIRWLRGEVEQAQTLGARSLAILTRVFGAEQKEVVELQRWLDDVDREPAAAEPARLSP